MVRLYPAFYTVYLVHYGATVELEWVLVEFSHIPADGLLWAITLMLNHREYELGKTYIKIVEEVKR